MENNESPELIERQMQETRNSLTDKVAALEQQVTGTLETASTVVHDTVATVKETVESVRTAMQDTVESVKDGVHESVESVTDTVRKTFDVSHHVRENPWLMIGGSVAAGVAAGLFVFGGRREGSDRSGSDRSWENRDSGHYSGSHSAAPVAAAAASLPSTPSWLDKLFERAGEELHKIGEQALDNAVHTLQQNVQLNVPHLVEELVGHIGLGSHKSGSASAKDTCRTG